MTSYLNTEPMCWLTGDGAVVLMGEDRLRSLPTVQCRAVKIAVLVTTSGWWSERRQAQPDNNTPTRRAGDQAYQQADVEPRELANARVGLTHVIGVDWACAVRIVEKAA